MKHKKSRFLRLILRSSILRLKGNLLFTIMGIYNKIPEGLKWLVPIRLNAPVHIPATAAANAASALRTTAKWVRCRAAFSPRRAKRPTTGR